MEIVSIPIESPQDSEGKFIIFRPLLGIAFIGNTRMAELTRGILTNTVPKEQQENASKVLPFLESIGFLAQRSTRPLLAK